ncbi:hypothetical protein [Campylobacter californiensis]|nr:hypothetical protein [Campylobacter sp. RM13119]
MDCIKAIVAGTICAYSFCMVKDIAKFACFKTESASMVLVLCFI